MTRSINITEPLLGILVVVIIALVLLGGIELGSVNSLNVLPQGTWVRVSLGTSRSLAHIGFLKMKTK